jgi:predicted GIY-YIG superfamily endonuclease
METLYRFYNADNELLYVGISGNWRNRLHQHERNSEWWNDVCYIKLEKFTTRVLVEDAEKRAIITEKPIWNKVFSLTYESPREHFERIKTMVRFGHKDGIHDEFVLVLQDALLDNMGQSLNAKAQYFAAVFIDNYGYPNPNCRNCEAIVENKYINSLAEIAWEKAGLN